MKKIGYYFTYKILNTCIVTEIPQNRERVFIVGFLNEDNYKNFKFDIKKSDKLKTIEELLEANIDDKYYYSDRFKVWDYMKNETFEEKLEHSKALLEKLMNPEITLEESVKLYEEGLKNIKEAQRLIEEAKTKITVIEQANQNTGDTL